MSYLFIIIFGLTIASFIETAAYRSSRGISIIKPPSFCDSCKTRLKIFEKLPIISYLILKGRCRYCKSRIPARYLITEIILPVIYVMIFKTAENPYIFIIRAYLITVMVYLSLLDIDTGYIRLPDIAFLYIGSIAFIILVLKGLTIHRILYYVYGEIIGITLITVSFGAIYLIKKRIPMGSGDLLIIPGISIFFGFLGTLRVLIISSTLGIFIGALLITFGIVKREHKFPLIPYLTAGIILEFLIFSP